MASSGQAPIEPRWFYWLIAVRVLLIVFAALIGYFMPGQFAGGQGRLWGVMLTGAALFLTLFYNLWYRAGRGGKWLFKAQIALDALMVGLAIFLTGRTSSPFTFLYPLVIVSACLVEGRVGGTMAALLSTVFYAMASLWGVSGERDIIDAALTFFIHMAAFNLTAFLGILLVQRLMRAEARLSRAVVDLKRIEEVHRHLADSLSSGLIVVDENGFVLTVNRSAVQILGKDVQDRLGAPLSEVWPEGAKRLFDDKGAAVRGGRLELGHKGPDGQAKIVGMSPFPLLGDGGRLLGFGLIFQDITGEKAREEALRRMDRLAALGGMAAGLAHEIRNPLASLSGAVEFLREQGLVHPDGERLFDIIAREAERLNGLTRSFLLYARPEGRESASINVRREFESSLAVAGLRRTAPGAGGSSKDPGVGIEIDIPDDLVMDIDPGQFRQVILNIILNAHQAIQGKGGRIKVKAMEEDGVVMITIEDNGCGIKKDDLIRIFDPFFTTRPDGTGLGLAIVHRLVQGWGGEIGVQSEEGKGARFTLRIPKKA
ncbi:ATP-binding protein [Dissulfurimicrobium hydrothermale]|uniref:ATP-binding protein n=1 Tax=Dissulfurimicrobium hydrothermale TaxID=1750598 RepID=UPI001EDC1725|nr:ATP-binding protein [Dissulfurimicrobium hydrothermale]UKL13774.1 PAS domain-containing protein [Dissulfurimicrobium hydrothermale]